MIKTGYMEERPGVKSNIRLMSMISLFAAVFCGVITLAGKSGDTNTGLMITAMFLSAAFAPKVVQKFAEGVILEKLNCGSAAPDPARGMQKPETIVPSFLK